MTLDGARPNVSSGASAGGSPQRRSPWSRLFAGFLVLLLAWHFLLTFTWNAAPNAVRNAIGSEVLTSWMTPLFTQGWAVFAPNPGAANVDFRVRALVPDEGGREVATEWFSVTDADRKSAVLHHPVPSRLYLNNYMLADRFHGAFLAVSADARDAAGNDYYGEEWPRRLESDLLGSLGVDHDSAVSDYLAYERTITGLATAIARARWGDDITGVQINVLTTPVIPFEQRNDPDATTSPNSFLEGWRAPLDVPGLDDSVVRGRYGVEASQ